CGGVRPALILRYSPNRLGCGFSSQPARGVEWSAEVVAERRLTTIRKAVFVILDGPFTGKINLCECRNTDDHCGNDQNDGPCNPGSIDLSHITPSKEAVYNLSQANTLVLVHVNRCRHSTFRIWQHTSSISGTASV